MGIVGDAPPGCMRIHYWWWLEVHLWLTCDLFLYLWYDFLLSAPFPVVSFSEEQVGLV